MRLVDLTVAVSRRRGLRRELLRWRELVASLYMAAEGEPVAHDDAFRALLLLNPISAQQIPFLLD